MHYDPLRLGPCPKDLSEWTSLPPPNNTPPTYNNTHKHNNSCHTRIRVPISTASAVHPACQAAAKPPPTIRLYTALLSALTYLSRTLHFQVPTGQLIDTLRRLAARARQLHPPQPYIAYISALRSPFTPAIAYISTLRSSLFAPPLVAPHCRQWLAKLHTRHLTAPETFCIIPPATSGLALQHARPIRFTEPAGSG